MKTSLLGLVVVVLAVGAFGCSSNSDGSASSDGSGIDGTPLACNDADDHLCQEFGAISDEDRQKEIYCKTENIVPSCSKDNLRASCDDSNYTGNNMTYWYIGGPGTDDQLKTSCDELTGQFTLN